MKHRNLLVAALLSLSALACSRDATAAPEPRDVAIVPIFRTVYGSTSELFKLAALAELPSDAVSRPVPGYPGTKVRMGAFKSAKAFAAFTRSAKSKSASTLRVNWKTQVVLYVVFDGQTNALSLKDFEVSGRTGTLDIQWDGIEPFYSGATPGVLAVVSREKLRTIDFTSGGKSLGRYDL